MKARSLIFFIICVNFQSLDIFAGDNHCAEAVEVIDVADFVEVKHASVDGVTFVFELDVNFVVGEDAHAVDLVSVYGFGELGETAVFVGHVGRRFDALCLVVLCMILVLVLVLRMLVVAFLVFMFRILRVDLFTFIIVLEVST